jgi:hypothetical protein
MIWLMIRRSSATVRPSNLRATVRALRSGCGDDRLIGRSAKSTPAERGRRAQFGGVVVEAYDLLSDVRQELFEAIPAISVPIIAG